MKCLIQLFGKERHYYSVAGIMNIIENKTDSINFVQSSFKTHPLWVTLYIDTILYFNPMDAKNHKIIYQDLISSFYIISII